LKTAWLKHSKDKDRIRKEFEASTFLLETLDKILEDKEKHSNGKVRNPEGYQMPKWEYYISHQFGYLEALDFVRQLIKDNKE